MGFFGSILGGSNPTVSGAIGQAGQMAGYGTSKGQGLSTQAGDFYSGLLSGDPSKLMKLMAPQIGAQQKQAQQGKQQIAQFGNRSGGTNAAAQAIDDKTRGNISKMISDMTSTGLAGAQQMGQSLIDTGMNALNKQVDFSQQQMENWSNSILGQGMASGAGAMEALGLAQMPGMSAAMSMFGG